MANLYALERKKSFYLLKITIFSIFILLNCTPFSIAKDSEENPKEKLLQLTQQNQKLIQENAKLSQIENNIETISSVVESSDFSSSLYEKISNELNKNLSELEIAPISNITTQSDIGFSFIQNLHFLSNIIYQPNLTVQEQIEHINPSKIDNKKLKESYKIYANNFAPQEQIGSLKSSFKLKDMIESKSIKSKDNLLKLLQKVKLETNKNALIQQNTYNVNKIVTTLKAYQNDINNVSRKNNDLINQNKIEIEKISSLKDITLNFNNRMYLTIAGMIIAVVIMYLSLIFSNKCETVKDILAKRTFVEVVSISFILLTMIILGTGELIKGETLGALLGTIAGYVFGKSNTPPN